VGDSEQAAEARLTLGTMRSHDQWNTTIYSNDDRYRGLRNLRTAIFMNTKDMREPRGSAAGYMPETCCARSATSARRAGSPS
jgi:hypothetical protein